MNDTKSKIKFYSLGSEKIDFSKIINNESLDSSKLVVTSKGFNKALKSVIAKDISFLSEKASSIVSEIIKILTINNFNDEEIKSDIEKIDDTLNEIEIITSKIIIEKESIKLGLFSTNKKEKKKKQKRLEECINTLTKYQSELISIKNEYNKLKQRSEVLKDVVFDEEKVSYTIEEDPLERTINFYMSKEKGN